MDEKRALLIPQYLKDGYREQRIQWHRITCWGKLGRIRRWF